MSDTRWVRQLATGQAIELAVRTHAGNRALVRLVELDRRWEVQVAVEVNLTPVWVTGLTGEQMPTGSAVAFAVDVVAGTGWAMLRPAGVEED